MSSRLGPTPIAHFAPLDQRLCSSSLLCLDRFACAAPAVRAARRDGRLHTRAAAVRPHRAALSKVRKWSCCELLCSFCAMSVQLIGAWGCSLVRVPCRMSCRMHTPTPSPRSPRPTLPVRARSTAAWAPQVGARHRALAALRPLGPLRARGGFGGPRGLRPRADIALCALRKARVQRAGGAGRGARAPAGGRPAAAGEAGEEAGRVTLAAEGHAQGRQQQRRRGGGEGPEQVGDARPWRCNTHAKQLAQPSAEQLAHPLAPRAARGGRSRPVRCMSSAWTRRGSSPLYALFSTPRGWCGTCVHGPLTPALPASAPVGRRAQRRCLGVRCGTTRAAATCPVLQASAAARAPASGANLQRQVLTPSVTPRSH